MAFYRLRTVAGARESSAETVVTFGLGFIALLLAGPACMAPSLGAIAEVPLALAMRVARVGSWAVSFSRRLFVS